MPRLGVSEGDIGGRAAPPAHAYHQSSSRRGSLWTMLSMLLTIFMLRNLFFKVRPHPKDSSDCSLIELDAA